MAATLTELAENILQQRENQHPDQDKKIVIPSITNLGDVEPEEVEFLWAPYIPLGKLTFLEGDPGLGKTFLALCICTAVSNGTLLPDQEGKPTIQLKKGNVLFMTQEDGLADTLVPRLDLMGADRNQIHCLTGWRTAESEEEQNFTLADINVLRASLEKVKPVLVVIDPLQAYLGGGVDMHRANETRPILSNLAKIAEEYHCAILIIRHLSKGSNKALYRGLGSIDFTAAARSVLMVGQEPNTKQKALAHIKSSCAANGVSLGFELHPGFGFIWSGVSSFSVEELLAPAATIDDENKSDKSSLDEAKEFLYNMLADGAVQCKILKKEAKEAGIKWRTVERAKEKIGFKAFKQGSEWYWPIIHKYNSTPPVKNDGGVGGLPSGLTEMDITGRPPTPPNGKTDGLEPSIEWDDLGTEINPDDYF